MKPKAPRSALRRQPTSQELRDTILGFICRHFYQGDFEVMVKDRTRLLRWVVLKPAAWLDERGVTIHPDDYRDLFLDAKNGLLMTALRHGAIEDVEYVPAYLGKVVESRLQIQGERLYEMAKRQAAAQSAQIADRVVAQLVGAQGVQRVDPVRQMAQAADLLSVRARAARVKPAGEQLSLL